MSSFLNQEDLCVQFPHCSTSAFYFQNSRASVTCTYVENQPTIHPYFPSCFGLGFSGSFTKMTIHGDISDLFGTKLSPMKYLTHNFKEQLKPQTIAAVWNALLRNECPNQRRQKDKKKADAKNTSTMIIFSALLLSDRLVREQSPPPTANLAANSIFWAWLMVQQFAGRIFLNSGGNCQQRCSWC